MYHFVIRSMQKGKRYHIVYRASRTMAGFYIANCGVFGQPAAKRGDPVVENNICLHCKRGPTQFIQRLDP